MADLNLNGHTKVKTFKAKFRETFGATLRVYKDVACQEGFADDEATLAAIRTAGAKGGELTVRSHMQVGNFEKKVAKLYGIGIQIANAEDTELVDDSITLSEVGSVTTTKTSENSSKKNHVRIEIEYTEYEYAPIDEDGGMIGDSIAFCFDNAFSEKIYIDDELSDVEVETKYSGYKPYKFDETERMGCWENSVREVYYLNVENFDASKLVMYFDCYDVPYGDDDTVEASFISLKYDGKVIESDQESYSCENNDFWEISIPTEFVKESTIIDEKPAELSMSLSEKFGILAATMCGIDGDISDDEIQHLQAVSELKFDLETVRKAFNKEVSGVQEYESQSSIVRSIKEENERLVIFRSLVMLAISEGKLSQSEMQLLAGIAEVWGWDWDDECCPIINKIIAIRTKATGEDVDIEE